MKLDTFVEPGIYLSLTDHTDLISDAPFVSVKSKTFTQTQSSREIQCVVDGNPANSFYILHHKSTYGELIGELDDRSTLVLPLQHKKDRYQGTGEYICIARNGIRDENENLDQKGSGYVISLITL